MKVILTSSLINYGNIGDIIEVKNGYAKNYLLPRKKAIIYSQSSLELFEKRKNDFEKLNQEKLNQATQIDKKLTNQNVIIIENASDDGRLYGSVNSATIAKKINSTFDYSLSKADVKISKPIREVGFYRASISMHSDITTPINIVVAKSEAEARALIKENSKAKEEAAKTEE